ncbi:hypothetical protein C8A00DRAFT_43752 [Chaetomidium leptoderma]|uniref:Uncharacterized protein n=1 Tax=Chaetomidium leptoderma TaxID=669021 RepID=A0AAN6VKM9_9PEZI|nr:hypothetical protein C8A00DRAFT_43752 [Chaetomidium leptoderma]
METVDLLIVGAGWHGLAMAKTYLEAHTDPAPKPRVLIVDESASIGGTWAAERLYPNLKTNNVVGSYEFSDFPMCLDRYGLGPGQHIPGEVVHQYLCDFAAHFHLDPLIRLRSKVDAVTLQDDNAGSWIVDYTTTISSEQQQHHKLLAHKLVIATGVTSTPNLPHLPGQSTFTGTVFHAKDLHSQTTTTTETKNSTVIVLGGNKSALDVCYHYAAHTPTNNTKVHLVLRPTGGGPGWVWRPLLNGRMSLARLSSTRAFTLFDPAPFGGGHTTLRRMLHGSVLGRWVVGLFWAVLGWLVSAAVGYGDEALRMLRPWTGVFWMGNSLSVHNYDGDWFGMVRGGRVEVHHAEVVGADTVVCCTGWECAPTMEFRPDGVGSLKGGDRALIEYVREGLVRRQPGGEVDVQTPYRLYRFLVPPSPRFLEKRNLAFIGAHRSVHAVVVAQCQALWITAFFQDRLPSLRSLDPETARYETFWHTEYERLRRPRQSGGSGARFPDLVFDSIPYVDMLLEDLGMRTLRKKTLWGNVFEPHTPRDYRGLTQEWIQGRSPPGGGHVGEEERRVKFSQPEKR